MTRDRVTARAACLKLKCGLPLAQQASDDLVFKPCALYVGAQAQRQSRSQSQKGLMNTHLRRWGAS